MGIIDLPTKTGVLKVMRVGGPGKNKPLMWVPGKRVNRLKVCHIKLGFIVLIHFRF